MASAAASVTPFLLPVTPLSSVQVEIPAQPPSGRALPDVQSASEGRYLEVVKVVRTYDYGRGRCKGKWWEFCKRYQRHTHDPGKQPLEFLERFLQEQTSERHDILAEQVDNAILAEQVHKFSTANRSRFFCDLCFMDMHTARRLVYHKLGPRHCARAAFVACSPDSLPDFWCEVCCLDMQSERALKRHQGGRRHMNQAAHAFAHASGEEKDRRVFLA